ncbi:HTH_Tnp_Tc3_2 domain-containing protein [Trichonephila clavipes]|nr:HTH_Tnp_Tc3_2 domain-containing protein [Trichonephila clavipes]
MCLNEEIVQPVSQARIAFECCYLVKSCCDASCKKQNAYQHVSDVDKTPIIAYGDCDLSYRSIAAHDGRDSITVRRIWNRWVQDGKTERCVLSQRPSITSR